MNQADVIDIATVALELAAKLSGPLLITALVVGLAISLMQSVTQLQEVTLSFVPKAIAVALVLVIAGNWMLTELITTTQELMDRIPGLLGG